MHALGRNAWVNMHPRIKKPKSPDLIEVVWTHAFIYIHVWLRLSDGMASSLTELAATNTKLIDMQGNAMVNAPTEYLDLFVFCLNQPRCAQVLKFYHSCMHTYTAVYMHFCQ